MSPAILRFGGRCRTITNTAAIAFQHFPFFFTTGTHLSLEMDVVKGHHGCLFFCFFLLTNSVECSFRDKWNRPCLSPPKKKKRKRRPSGNLFSFSSRSCHSKDNATFVSAPVGEVREKAQLLVVVFSSLIGSRLDLWHGQWHTHTHTHTHNTGRLIIGKVANTKERRTEKKNQNQNNKTIPDEKEKVPRELERKWAGPCGALWWVG